MGILNVDMLSLTRQLNLNIQTGKYVVCFLRPLTKCSNFRVSTRRQRNRVAQLVEALRYKSEGRGFDSR